MLEDKDQTKDNVVEEGYNICSRSAKVRNWSNWKGQDQWAVGKKI